MAKVGKNIKNQRTKLGMSQETLAEKLFVSRQTISNYEIGKSYPDIDMLVRIAEVLNVDIKFLVYGEAAMREAIVFDKNYLKTDLAASCIVYIAAWCFVWWIQSSNQVSIIENLLFNCMISAGIVIIHIFVHWLVGIYKKGRVLTEEIKNSCLTNVLEFVLCIFLMRNLWFIHGFFFFPEFYVTIFFGMLTVIEVIVVLFRGKYSNNRAVT